MPSPLLVQKHRAAFNIYDRDRDGKIRRDDFRALALAITGARGQAPDSPEALGLIERFDLVWQSLSPVDTDGDGIIGFDEYLAGMMALISNVEFFRAGQDDRIRFIFDLFDTNNDGEITLDEYTTFFEACGIDRSAAPFCFAKLDRDGDGRLSRDEVLRADFDHATSEDPEALGNWLLGPLAS
jgi:Ca2+-binding EF-hand superfamily protein